VCRLNVTNKNESDDDESDDESDDDDHVQDEQPQGNLNQSVVNQIKLLESENERLAQKIRHNQDLLKQLRFKLKRV